MSSGALECNFALLLQQPVFHVVSFALALEVELDVVQGIADLLEWGLRIEILVAIGQ